MQASCGRNCISGRTPDVTPSAAAVDRNCAELQDPVTRCSAALTALVRYGSHAIDAWRRRRTQGIDSYTTKATRNNQHRNGCEMSLIRAVEPRRALNSCCGLRCYQAEGAEYTSE